MLMLRPWQLNLTDNAIKLIDKLIEKDVEFKFKFNAMKLLENKNVFVNDFVNKPPKLKFKFKVMKLRS